MRLQGNPQNSRAPVSGEDAGRWWPRPDRNAAMHQRLRSKPAEKRTGTVAGLADLDCSPPGTPPAAPSGRWGRHQSGPQEFAALGLLEPGFSLHGRIQPSQRRGAAQSSLCPCMAVGGLQQAAKQGFHLWCPDQLLQEHGQDGLVQQALPLQEPAADGRVNVVACQIGSSGLRPINDRCSRLS